MTPRAVLLAAGAFGEALGAQRAGAAIARGLRARAPSLVLDLCPIHTEDDGPQYVRALLDTLDFDARMRRARAVVIAHERLDHDTLLHGGAAFEIATRARQAGVPCCAITAGNGLDLFEARILDLQIVLEAAGERALATAGRKLADLLS